MFFFERKGYWPFRLLFNHCLEKQCEYMKRNCVQIFWAFIQIQCLMSFYTVAIMSKRKQQGHPCIMFKWQMLFKHWFEQAICHTLLMICLHQFDTFLLRAMLWMPIKLGLFCGKVESVGNTNTPVYKRNTSHKRHLRTPTLSFFPQRISNSMLLWNLH